MGRARISPKQSRQIADLYREGMHSTEIEKIFGTCSANVLYHVRKHGIQVRNRSQTNRMRAPVDEDRLRKLVAEAELSQREIAERLGVSQATIERTCRSLGLRSLRGRGSKGPKNNFWKGGKPRRDRHEYVLVWQPDHPHARANGCVLEHRLVMEKHLGRYLEPHEVVHHIDGDKKHNELENLALFSSNSEHMKHEHESGLLDREPETGRLLGRRQSASIRPASGSGDCQ